MTQVFMGKLLLAAVLLPRIYFMEVEVQNEIGIEQCELRYTDSMDLITTSDAGNIVLVAELCED